MMRTSSLAVRGERRDAVKKKLKKLIKWKIRSVVEDEEKLAPSYFASGNMYTGPADMESS